MATRSRTQSLRLPVLLAAAFFAATLLLGLLFAGAPARAMVTNVGSTKVGLQPRSVLLFDGMLRFDPLFELETMRPEPEDFANESGNAIVSSSKTYVIYWDPIKDYYHGDWQHVIDTFFQSMGAASGSLGNVFAVDAQYTDAANQHALYNTTFQGAYTDTDSYPPSGCTDPEPPASEDQIGPEVKGKHTPVCLTDQQLKEELTNFVSQHGLPKGMGTIFYLLTPPAITACLESGPAASHCSDYKRQIYDGGESQEEKEHKEAEERAAYEQSFCSYHSDMDASNSSGGENTILYGVIPWTAGGVGDGDLVGAVDKGSAYDCQDGGYDPSSKPIEKHEEKKEKGTKEIKEDEEKSAEEQAKIAAAELLEGPHQEEPNQVKCPSPDGWCDTGLADLIVNQIAVEQQNIITDPLLDGWQDPHGYEATDECRDFFAPVLGGNVGAQEGSFGGTLYNQALNGNTYYLNDGFNLAALKLPYPGVPCLGGVTLLPQFTTPNPVKVNEIVGFDGMESDISLNAGVDFNASGVAQPNYATYTWNFGDGSAPVSGYAPGASLANSPNVSNCGSPTEWQPPCAASVYHTYAYGGTYEVSLTVTDVGGNTATVKQPITVVGPAPPSPEPTPTPTPTPTPSVTPPPAPSTGSTGSTDGSGSAGQTSSTPAPVLGAAVTSKSLKKALKSGLPVRYSTNEQVAGKIEVLLESSVAKRLHIKGATATGLPAGSPKSIVVGSAVLVTTRAGHGTIRIKFSSRAAARLKHTRRLKVILRLFARNASRQSPQSTTMLSTVVLKP